MRTADGTVLLTNFIPPYRLELYGILQQKLAPFYILLSAPTEPDRTWEPEWPGLNVTVQRSLTLKRIAKHPYGFREELYLHVPYDTLPRLRRLRPRVILSAEFGARTLQALLYRRLHPKTRLIVWATLSEHTEKGRGRLRRLLRRAILHGTDAVLVNGASGRSYIASFGYPDQRTFTVPQPVSLDPFLSAARPRDSSQGHRLLYVGQLSELKGIVPFVEVLISWAERNPQRSTELWLAGQGPLAEVISTRALPPNLSVRLLGFVPYAELPAVYAQCGVLCFPTFADEWGLVVNEAMAAGLPVLGSLYSQAVEELVEDDVTGWTFHPDDPAEMLAALDKALTAPCSVLEQMGARGQERIRKLTPSFAAGRIVQAVDFVTSH